jgi:hypothetical protein
MPTTVTKTIKPSGGDYTTVGAWESGEQGDLVAADEVRVGVCYAFLQSAAVTIDGSTTSSTQYPKLTVDPTARHAGILDETSEKFRWVLASFGELLRLSDPFTRIEYVQFKNTDPTFGGGPLVVDASDCLIEQCIGTSTSPDSADWGAGIDVNATGLRLTVRNSAFWHGYAGVYLKASATGCVFENCTFAGGTFGFSAADGTLPTLRNVYLHGTTRACQAPDLSGPPGNNLWVTTTCFISDTSIVQSGVTNSTPHSTANFQSVTVGIEDYHLAAGSALRGVGTDLSATFTGDFESDTRSAWDVGADEFSPFYNLGKVTRLNVSRFPKVFMRRK